MATMNDLNNFHIVKILIKRNAMMERCADIFADCETFFGTPATSLYLTFQSGRIIIHEPSKELGGVWDVAFATSSDGFLAYVLFENLDDAIFFKLASAKYL